VTALPLPNVPPIFVVPPGVKPSGAGIRHSSIASIRSGPGLRAMTIGSHAGFRLARPFGKPEA
jgi:hypothetical protein